jgi:hypothetical protein
MFAAAIEAFSQRRISFRIADWIERSDRLSPPHVPPGRK